MLRMKLRVTLFAVAVMLWTTTSAMAQLQGIGPSSATPSGTTSPQTRQTTNTEASPDRPAPGVSSRLLEERRKRLDDLVVQLTKEANDLDKMEGEVVNPVFRRPHPAMAQWGPEMAILTLNRMPGRFTGNQFRDTYIRWHLMWVVKKTELGERPQTTQPLRRLLRDMPDSSVPANTVPDHRYEPQEIASRYFSLANQGNVVVGYPPFQKVIGPPASYEYMSAERAATVRANLAEAAQLRDQFQTIIDQGARQRNHRIRQVNHLIREYRGELIYELLKSGDDQVAMDVIDEVARLGQARDPMSLDLISYIYLAAFDGVLSRYQADTLRAMSRRLESAARANQQYVQYGGQYRNFGDYAFHLIYMLEDGGGFFEAETRAPTTAGPRPSFRR